MGIYCSLRITVFIRKFLLTKEKDGEEERWKRRGEGREVRKGKRKEKHKEGDEGDEGRKERKEMKGGRGGRR